MRSAFLSLALVVSLAACGGAAQTSATTKAVPPARPTLLGTRWASVEPHPNGETERLVYRFDANGKLHYERDRSAEGGEPADDEKWDDGHWTQDGNSVAIDMNDHYAEMRGTIIGDSMEGTAWNKVGSKWKWSAKKLP